MVALTSMGIPLRSIAQTKVSLILRNRILMSRDMFSVEVDEVGRDDFEEI